MSEQLVIRRRHRKKQPLPLCASAGGFALREPLPAGPAGETPSLTLREPESARSALISGGLSAFLHLGLFGAIVVAAWLAPPETIRKLIPVEIIREKPGSNEAPAPARPRVLRRSRPRTMAAQRPRAVPRVAPRAPLQPAVQPIDAQAIQVQNLDPLKAPTELRRRRVTSRQVTVRRTAASPQATAAQVSAVDVRPTDLNAPQVDFDGPRQIVPGAQVVIGAPEAFTDLSDPDPADYQAAAPDAVFTSEGDVDGSAYSAIEIDTDLDLEFVDGGVVGGTGTAVGVVPCMQSAFVVRYNAILKQRVLARWTVPPGFSPGEEVVLIFQLDSSGAATSIEFKGDVDPALGQSAVAAMRAASPFPPMDDNVRCLAEIRLRGTFSSPTY